MRVLVKKIKDEHTLGLCFPDGTIHIDPRQRKLDFLDTAIHEALHRACPKMKERKVRKIAPVIAKVLWRLKYRRN